MPAIPRTYFDAPAANPMAGWSEERKRFFQQYGYDRGPGAMEQGATMMGEGNILQRKRGPEVNVKITETPPDDPTPTKTVTSIKYPEQPYMGAEEQWGAQEGLPTEGLLAQPSLAPGVQFDEYAPRRGEGGMADFDERGMQQYWQDAAQREQRQPIGGTGVQYEGGSEDDNIRNIIRSAFRKEDWETAERLIMEESSGDPNAINPEGEYSLGLLQVNWDVWGKGGEYEYLNERLKPILGRDLTQEDLFDPRINIHAAAAIKDRQGWDAWRLSMEKLAAKGYAPEAVTEEVVTESPTGGMLADAYVDVGQGDFPGRLEEMNERGMAAYNAEAEARARRQQMAEPTPEQLFGPQETIAGAPDTSWGDMNALFMAQMGQNVLFVDDDGEEVTFKKILDEQAQNMVPGMAGVRVGFNVLKGMNPGQLRRYWNYIKKFVRGGKGKPKDTYKRPDRWTEADRQAAEATAAAGGRGTSGVAIPTGARTAGARTAAQTTEEAANAAKVAGRFKTAVPGIRTAGVTTGLLGLGSQIEDKPWWLDSFYNRAGAGLGAIGEFFSEDVWPVITGAVDKAKETTEEKSSRQAEEGLARESFGDAAFERFKGLLEDSAEEVTNTTAEDIGQDWDAETGGMLEGEDDESGMSAWYASNEAKRKAIEEVARQNSADKQAEIDRYYDKFPEDIEGKRERYLKALNQIYKKVAILNVIAALTNSPSQAGAFMQLAAEKFKTLEGFRGEERLQKIARGVFFDQNGNFDAPKDKQAAFDRAMRFGANHDEALALSGHKKEYAPAKTETGVRIWSNAETGQQIWLPKDQAPSGEGWLPTKLDKVAAGTEYERQRANAIELLNAGNEEAAIADLENWFISKNSMMQLMPEQATIIVKYIIDNLKRGIVLSDDEIRNQARVGGAEVDYAYEGVVE